MISNKRIIQATALLTVSIGAQVASAVITPIGQVYPAPWVILPTDNLYVGDTLSARMLTLGNRAGVHGQIDLSDPGSALTLSQGINAGVNGSAVINVFNGATLTSSSPILGGEKTGSAVVTIDGPASKWIQNGNLTLGRYGAGTLYITDGAMVQSRRVDMAANYDSFSDPQPTASGFARVSGAGSLWQLTGSMTVGITGPAQLEVLSGAKLTSTSTITIGQNAFSPSSALFVGTGTTVQFSTLSIASDNTSTLDLAGGATLTTGTVTAGVTGTGLAQITMDGTDTNWQITGNLLLGDAADAEFEVRGGASLISNDAWLGAKIDGAGDVVVTGPGTTWTLVSRPPSGSKDKGAKGELFIGSKGSGVLRIADQAQVDAAFGAYVGFNPDLTFGHSGASGALILDNATLITPNLLVSADDLSGTGVIQTQGWIVDGTWSASSIADLPVQQQVNDLSGTDIDVQINWASASGVFGAGYKGAGAVTINGGFVYQTAHGLIGYGSEADGSVQIVGAGTSWDAGRLSIGYSGKGELWVKDSATLLFDSTAIGESAGSDGTLRLSGAGTTADYKSNIVSGTLVIGQYGTGRVFVEDGAKLEAKTVVLGDEVGSNAEVRVSNQSIWSTGNVTVGDRGQGVFNVTSGSSLTAYLFAGLWLGSLGTITVGGAGTTWNNSNLDAGFTNIYIEDGADVDLNTVKLGMTAAVVIPDGYDPYVDPPLPNAPSLSLLTVRGAGTDLFVSSEMNVGYDQYGGVTVEDDAAMTVRALYLGRNADALGTVLVDGPNASLTAQYGFWIGYSGAGNLVVLNGGSFQSNAGVIGYNPDSRGQLTVFGPGSSASFNGELSVRYSDDVAINILNGGVVNVGAATLLTKIDDPVVAGTITFDNGILNTVGLLGDSTKMLGTGTINADHMLLDGNWSFDASTPLPSQLTLNNQPGQNIAVNLAWSAADDFFGAGSGTTGKVLLHNGADVTSENGYIGLTQTGNGTVTIQDRLSRWTVSDSLYVGYGGVGTLALRQSGVGRVYQMFLGRFNGSNGSVTVEGAGSVLDLDYKLNVGYSGYGQLHISNSALVLASSITEVANTSTSTGLIQITGLHSTLVTPRIDLGRSGRAEMHVSNGGIAMLGDVNMGYSNGSSSLLTITGAGTFVQTDDLLVSRSGDAELYITDGAEVETIGLVRVGGYFIPANPSIAHLVGTTTRWTTRDFYVGKGELLVTQGASLESEDVKIGVWDNSTALATVEGTQSSWHVTQTLTLADMNRPAKLVIREGAHVDVAGNMTILARGELVLGVSSGAPTPLTVLGNSVFDGKLHVDLDPSAIPADQSITTIIDTAGTTTGAFDNVLDGTLIGVQFGVAMHALLTAGDGNDIAVKSTYLATGDLDGSGAVDENDLYLIMSNWGQPVAPGNWLLGDADNDGQVGILDLNLTLNNWGPTPSPTVIPEPASLLPLTFGLLLGTRRRRRDARRVLAGKQTIVVPTTGKTSGTSRRHRHAVLTCAIASTGLLLNTGNAAAAVTWSGAVYPFPTETTTYENNDLFIGYNTLGTLNITDGGVVKNAFAYVGYLKTAAGVLNISGQNSLWESGNVIHAGYRGDATIRVLDGAYVKANDVVIGYYDSGSADILVSGNGTTFDARNLTAGYQGYGQLVFQQSALINASSLAIDFADAFVQGPGTTLTTQYTIALAGSRDKPARLTLRDQAQIQSNGIYMGSQFADANARITIDGAGTHWTNIGETRIGLYDVDNFTTAESTIEILNGGKLTTFSADIGDFGPAQVRLSGANSLWNAGNFYVGLSSQGLIQVQNGALASGYSALLGIYAGSEGIITVRGANARLSLSQDLTIAHHDQASGRVEVLDGGKINISRNLFMKANSSLLVSLNPATSTAPIVVTQQAQLAGKLDITPATGATLIADRNYPIMSIGTTRTGTFAGLAEGDVVDVWFGLSLKITYTGGDGNDIWVRSSMLTPGDLDASGAVDQADLNLVLANFGNTVHAGHWRSGDANNNGFIEAGDMDIILSHWTNPGIAPATVPEPVGMVVFAGFAIMGTTRRRQ